MRCSCRRLHRLSTSATIATPSLRCIPVAHRSIHRATAQHINRPTHASLTSAYTTLSVMRHLHSRASPVHTHTHCSPHILSRHSFHSCPVCLSPAAQAAAAQASPSSAAAAPSPSPSPASPSPPMPGPTGLPIPEGHRILFEQKVLPSPDSIVNPSDKVKEIYKEMMNMSQFELLQLTEVMQQSYGVRMDFGAASGYGFGRGGALGAGAGPATQAAPAAASPVTQQPAAAAAAAPAAATPTSFSIKLESFAAADKIKVIKEVRTITGLGLKESKELVESVPKFIKRDLTKAECDTLVAKLKEAGAKVTVE